MAANVAVAQDPAGNLKPAKDKSTERIDGIVAIIMAIGRAMLAQEEPQPSYQMFFVVNCAQGLPHDARRLVGRQHHRPAALRQAGGGPAVRPLGHAARAVEPAADLHPAAGADQGQAHLMTVFQGAVDATFAAFGIDAVYTPAGGEPVPVRVIARRPDTIVGFGETRIHAETATFELRASEVANPRPGDQLTVGGETFVVQGEPERRDPDRLVWTLDVRPA